MKKIEINQELFTRLYLEEEYSTRELAEYFGIGQTTVRRRIKAWNIPARNSKESKQTARFKKKHKEHSESMEVNVKRQCGFCEQILLSKPHLSQKFCSRECYINFTKEKSCTEVVCTQCGKTYKTKNRNLKVENKFCSFECQGAYKAEQFVGENSHSYNRVERECGFCGKTLAVPQHRNKREKVYCNIECMGKDYQERMIGENNPHWKGGKINYYGPTWLEQRRVCRKRDNYTCQRCGLLEEELGTELTVHHIKLFREFPSSDEANHIDNLITLCSTCHTFVHSNKNVNKEFLDI